MPTPWSRMDSRARPQAASSTPAVEMAKAPVIPHGPTSLSDTAPRPDHARPHPHVGDSGTEAESEWAIEALG